MLYQFYREGTSFSYAIPLPTSGSYSLTLKFNEPTKTAAGQRNFDVAAEGTLILDDLDIYAAAGGKNIAHDRTFSVSVTDGTLDLTFTGVLDQVIVSAIEVTWAGTTPPVPLASYLYRADGLRHSKTAGGSTTTYTWDVGAKLPVILQDGTNTYVYGHGLISQTDAAGVQTYLLGNGLGSTEKITDSAGNVTATYKYDVFGAIRSQTGTGNTEYRFTGQQDDPTVGLTYLRARYYDQATGRFLSKDPFPGVASDPGTQHDYTYVRNNPVNLTDPNGQCFIVGCAALILGGAAVTGEVLGDAVILTAAVGTAVAAVALANEYRDEIPSAIEGWWIVFSNPHGSKGGPAHQEEVQERIEELKQEGKEHLHGGDKTEEVVPTEGGAKSSRRPDITMRDPDTGEIYRENVGRATQSGEPVSREREALDDIERATGVRPHFTPF